MQHSPTVNAPSVIIAPDSFKGTATATEAATWLGEGVQQVFPEAAITLTPMADGGEGTAATFNGTTITLPTVDAAGRLTEASYVWNEETATAYIDIAAATGLPAVADNPVPLSGDTYGTGVLIADAETRGAHTIALALGGSATIDGGSGFLVALGAQLLNKKGHPVAPGGGHLGEVASIDTAQLNYKAAALNWVLLADVTTPATGPAGAAAVFGPQKGASPEDVELLDANLAHFCELLEVDPTRAGMGAAGGAAIALTWLSRLVHGTDEHLHILPGAAVVADALTLPVLIPEADLIITGEGKMDSQTAAGKVVATVLRLAAPHPITPAIVAGTFEQGLSLPEGVLSFELPRGVEVETQLRQAGRAIAELYAERHQAN